MDVPENRPGKGIGGMNLKKGQRFGPALHEIPPLYIAETRSRLRLETVATGDGARGAEARSPEPGAPHWPQN